MNGGFSFLATMSNWSNIILIAGSGQNAGKTTFVCALTEHVREQNPICIKVSSHFYKPTPGLRELAIEPGYELYEETDRSSRKDSSLYLQHGAARSFFLQAEDKSLQEAFLALMPFLDSESPILIESAALQHVIEAGLFILVVRDGAEHKPSTEINRKIADLVVTSDGHRFNPQPTQLSFNGKWKIIPA